MKIAGSEISRMEEFSVAARMPTVVTDSAIATRRGAFGMGHGQIPFVR